MQNIQFMELPGGSWIYETETGGLHYLLPGTSFCIFWPFVVSLTPSQAESKRWSTQDHLFSSRQSLTLTCQKYIGWTEKVEQWWPVSVGSCSKTNPKGRKMDSFSETPCKRHAQADFSPAPSEEGKSSVEVRPSSLPFCPNCTPWCWAEQEINHTCPLLLLPTYLAFTGDSTGKKGERQFVQKK